MSPLVKPFAGIRPAPGKAADVAAPPYDVVTPEQVRAISKAQPFSFLRVSRADALLPEGVDPYSEVVYTEAARNFRNLMDQGLLVRDERPSFYAYRMTAPERSQTGIAVAVSAEAYQTGRIRKHELTRKDKEDDRVRQIEAVEAITGPVMLFHKANPDLADIMTRVVVRDPVAVAPDVDGVTHELWDISDPEGHARISALLNAMDALYIADGHHRSAAGSRVIDARRATGRVSDGFLGITFPENEVTILGYDRLVRDLNGHSVEELVSILSRDFVIRHAAGPVRPQTANAFGLCVEDRWMIIEAKVPPVSSDPVERMPVSLLARKVLQPVLGIEDQRTDPRIDFVGGEQGAERIARRIATGEMVAGFTLPAASLDDLMAVADSGGILPPKTTWFDPKLADGLISLPLN